MDAGGGGRGGAAVPPRFFAEKRLQKNSSKKSKFQDKKRKEAKENKKKPTTAAVNAREGKIGHRHAPARAFGDSRYRPQRRESVSSLSTQFYRVASPQARPALSLKQPALHRAALNDHLLLLIVLAELLGRAALALLEQPVEVRQRVEAAVIADLRYRLR